MHAKSLQLCLSLCDPVDCSLSVLSVLWILQERVLKWVATPTSSESSQPKEQILVSYVSCIGRQVLYHWRRLKSPEFIIGY